MYEDNDFFGIMVILGIIFSFGFGVGINIDRTKIFADQYCKNTKKMGYVKHKGKYFCTDGNKMEKIDWVNYH